MTMGSTGEISSSIPVFSASSRVLSNIIEVYGLLKDGKTKFRFPESFNGPITISGLGQSSASD